MVPSLGLGEQLLVVWSRTHKTAFSCILLHQLYILDDWQRYLTTNHLKHLPLNLILREKAFNIHQDNL